MRFMSTRYTAAADIPAPVGQIFELLVEPANHHLFDDTKMVGAQKPQSGWPGWAKCS